jgi:ornithine cyclodeaminase/alanine dehydrogenase-like protein (mu-crystallin family)
MRALDMLCGLARIAGVAADMARHLMETEAPVRWARRTAAITAAAAAAHAVCDAEAALLVGVPEQFRLSTAHWARHANHMI